MASSELYNQEAESLVLAAMLRYPDEYYAINDIDLVADDFLGPENKRVARAIFEVVAEKNKPDLPLVLESLRLAGQDDTTEYVGALTSVPCSVTQAHEYARTVKGLAVNRQIAHTGARMIELAREKRSDYEGAIVEAEKLLRKVAENVPEPERSPIPADIIRRLHNVASTDRIPISFSPTLQSITGGFAKGHFWVIGGFTSTGKSAVACNIALDALKSRGKRVLIFSTEMTQEQFMIRMLSMKSGVTQKAITDNVTVGLDNQQALAKAIKELERAPLRVYDEIYRMPAIRAESKRAKEVDGVDLIILDFIQNVSITGDEVSDAREVALECQRLAKELDCTVIALSQVANQQAKDDIAAGGAGDYYSFKGHGAIRDAADVAIMLRRNRRDQSSTLKFQVAKNRHGPLAEFDCILDLKTGLVEEVEWNYEEDE